MNILANRPCQRQGCDRRASLAPKLRIPAAGWRIDQHEACHFHLGLELCREHAEELDLRAVITDSLRRAVSEALKSMMRTPPDFERAWLEFLRLDSEEYLRFIAVKKKPEAPK